jgi:hypothetical protein
MRHALSVVVVLAVLDLAAPAARADWLVLVGGKRIETEGPWTLKGDLLTVHERTGRILTVSTRTVDAAACLKANGGSLRIEAVSVPPPPGAPVVKPEVISPSARPLTPHPAAAPIPTTAPAPPIPPIPVASNNGTAASAKPPRDDRAAAAKLARQAQLQRELRYKQIVDGCERMFIVDRAGFQHCVAVQTKAPPAPAPQPAPSRP